MTLAHLCLTHSGTIQCMLVSQAVPMHACCISTPLCARIFHTFGLRNRIQHRQSGRSHVADHVNSISSASSNSPNTANHHVPHSTQLCQNADDARATRIAFVNDRRSFPTGKTACPALSWAEPWQLWCAACWAAFTVCDRAYHYAPAAARPCCHQPPSSSGRFRHELKCYWIAFNVHPNHRFLCSIPWCKSRDKHAAYIPDSTLPSSPYPSQVATCWGDTCTNVSTNVRFTCCPCGHLSALSAPPNA